MGRHSVFAKWKWKFQKNCFHMYTYYNQFVIRNYLLLDILNRVLNINIQVCVVVFIEKKAWNNLIYLTMYSCTRKPINNHCPIICGTTKLICFNISSSLLFEKFCWAAGHHRTWRVHCNINWLLYYFFFKHLE